MPQDAISNANPWDNLKFDLESQKYVENSSEPYTIPILSLFVCQYWWIQIRWSRNSINERPEIDQWIIWAEHFDKDVDGFYADYEPQKLVRYLNLFRKT
jgi:isoleucyl-tRNA synthetase